MVCGKKLLHSVDVRAWMLRCLFPDGRRVKSGCGQPRCWWLFGCSMWCKCLWRTEERPQWSSLLSSLSVVGVLQSKMVQFPNQIVIQLLRMLYGGGSWTFSAFSESRDTAFFVKELVLRDQVKFSTRWTQRNLLFLTIVDVQWRVVKNHLFCFVYIQKRLFALHQSFSLCTSYADSSFLLMRPSTVVSSANLMIWLVLYIAAQLWVSRVNRRGLSTQPWGAPVLSGVVLFPIQTDWGHPIKKSMIQWMMLSWSL